MPDPGPKARVALIAAGLGIVGLLAGWGIGTGRYAEKVESTEATTKEHGVRLDKLERDVAADTAAEKMFREQTTKQLDRVTEDLEEIKRRLP